ncbi:MAG TPA: hypothetical protein VLU96_07265 [Gaiellaceae bacterium]|nr:hypothetical protein [Gaiellaceae bacterium]
MFRLVPIVAALVVCSGAAATDDASGWCRAPQPASWKRIVAGSVVGLSRHASVLPIVGANDGRSFLAELYSPSFSGVVRIDARTSRVTRIRRFPSARNDQADGSWDGRWLVWNEYHSLSDDFADFTTFAWDSRSGRVTQIGAAKRDPDGNFWPSGWRQPDVRNGFATWTQGTGPDDESELHVYDLARSRDRVVRRGHPQGSFFVNGPTVIWSESLTRGALTKMLAADARTGNSLPPPPALAHLRGISGLFTDGHALAYPSARFTSLWWSPSLGGTPRLIFKPRKAVNHIENGVRIAARYVIFSDTGKGYLADTHVRRYVELGVDPVAVDRHALIVSSWTKGKTLHPRNRISFVPVRSLPRLARCAG